MAWFGRLDSPAVLVGTKIQITINYYDTAGPFEADGTTPRILHTATAAWGPATQLAEVTAWLKSEGRQARAAYVVAAGFNQSTPVGTTVPVD